VLPQWLQEKLAHYARLQRRALIAAGQLHTSVGEEPSYTDYRYDQMAKFWQDIDDRSTSRSSSRLTTGARPVPYKLPDVCRECNHGWMSRLEAAVGLIIPGLMEGVEKRLTSFDQMVLSTWMIKTCLTYDAAVEPRWIPAEDGSRLLFKYGYPIPGSSVLIANDREHKAEGVFVHGRMLLRADPSVTDVDAVRFQFQFDRLIIQAMINIGGHDNPRTRGARPNRSGSGRAIVAAGRASVRLAEVAMKQSPVTNDTGMTMRAHAQKLKVVSMPEEYLRQKPRSEVEES
jgi:hypothetical protein